MRAFSSEVINQCLWVLFRECVILWSLRCIQSFLICCSMATIPSFFLLAILALTFCLACLTCAPLARCSSCAIRAAFTVIVQYFWVSIWNLVSLVKLISRREQLALGTSSGAKLIETLCPAWFLWHSLYADSHDLCHGERYYGRSIGSEWFGAALI